MSAIGRLSSQGKTSISIRRMTLLLWVFFHTGERLANHSRAIASKPFSVLAIRCLRLPRGHGRVDVVGQLAPAGIPALAGALQGDLRETPKDTRFSLPPYVYLNRHQRLPVGVTSIYSPRPSWIRKTLSRGRTFRIRESLSLLMAMWGNFWVG